MFSVAGAGEVGNTLLTGDLANDGVLEFDVDMVNELADVLDVAGQLTLGGSLEVTIEGETVARVQQYTLIDAATSSGEVTFSSLGLPPIMQARMTGAGTSARGIELRPDFSMARSDLSGNRAAVARHLNEAVLANPDEPMQIWLNSIVRLPTVESVETVLQQLHPEPLLTIAPATWRSGLRFNDTLHSCRVREDEYRFVAEGECTWGTIGGSWYEQDSTAERIGYDRSSMEVVVGVQREVAAGLQVGFGFSFEDSSANVSGLANLDGKQFEFGTVAKMRSGGTSFSASIGIGHGSYETIRFVSLPGDVAVARGEQDLTSVMAGLRLAHDFGNATWYLRPQVDLTGTHLRLGSMTESNEYAGDLRAAPDSQDYVAVQPALEFGGELAMLNATLIRPFARIGVTELLTDSEVSASALFAGTPSGVAPFEATHDFEDSYIDASLGVDVLFTNGASARLVYGGQFADDSREDTATVKFRIPF